jgi:hypothetical protein
MLATDQNCLYEEFRSRFNSQNTYYHLVQDRSSLPLLSRSPEIKIYKTVSSYTALCVCVCVCVLSHGKGRRRIFEPKREDVTGGWRKFHKEKIHNVCSSERNYYDDKIKKIRWVENVARIRKTRD